MTRQQEFEITEPSAADVAFVEDRLYEFNASTTAIGDGLTLGVFLRNESGAILAAATGHTWGGVCELRQVWVAEPLRNRGVGRQLMAKAEAEAIGRDCVQIVLTTHSFQAPGFYRKLGFEIVSEIPDCPRGHSHMTLLKRLRNSR